MKKPSKRVNIVSLKMVKEASVLYENRKVASPNDAVDLIKDFLQESDREKCILICLDTKNQPTFLTTISIGSLNSSIIHPREVFKLAIMSNSASIIMAHNHPSGDPNPSKEDMGITKRLVEAGEILGIKIIDHIIVGDGDRYYSFKENDHL